MNKKTKTYLSVIAIGLFFMCLFSAYLPIQNIVSAIYDQQNYQNLGQISLFVLYIGFGITPFFASYIVDRLGYKYTIFISALGYPIYQFTGLLVSNCKGSQTGVCNINIVYIVVIIGALICGISSGLIWVAQSCYVSNLADQNNKGQLFALFWILMTFSQIFGNLINTFVLDKITNFHYFLIMGSIGTFSAFLFLMLPQIKNQTAHINIKKSLKTGISDIIKKFIQKESFSINIYYLFNGIAIGSYAGFLYKLINKSYLQKPFQTNTEYQKDLKFHIGLVFLALGVTQVITALVMNRFSDRFNKYKLAMLGCMIVQSAIFTSFLAYLLNSYELCMVSACFWGISQVFLQSNTSALISEKYNGSLVCYSVYRSLYGFGISFTLIVNVLFSSLGLQDYIFLIFIQIFQIVVTIISLNLQGISKINEDVEQKLIKSQN